MKEFKITIDWFPLRSLLVLAVFNLLVLAGCGIGTLFLMSLVIP